MQKRKLMKTLLLILLSFTLSAQKIPSDAKHVYATCGITHAVGWVVQNKTDRPGLSCLIGMSSGMLVGLGKEYIWDRKLGKGEFSKLDIANDAWGCLLGGLTLRVAIDWKEVGFIPRKKKDKYFIGKE